MEYVFVSYSSKSQEKADTIINIFQDNSIRCRMAPYDITAGTRYASIVNENMKNASCFVLLLTDAEKESVFVSKEVDRAISYKKPIITVEMENMDEHGLQKIMQGIRSFTGQEDCDSKHKEEHFKKDIQADDNADIKMDSISKAGGNLDDNNVDEKKTYQIVNLIGFNSVDDFNEEIEAAKKMWRHYREMLIETQEKAIKLAKELDMIKAHPDIGLPNELERLDEKYKTLVNKIQELGKKQKREEQYLSELVDAKRDYIG